MAPAVESHSVCSSPASSPLSDSFDLLSPVSSTITTDASHPSWKHCRATLFGRRLSVATFDAEKFLIGVQIAALLKRETFNMYRSMKIKNVDIQRASPQQVEFLARANAVRAGTHSVTLIPYHDGLYFVADAWVKQHKSEALGFSTKGKSQRSFIVERPKLHRRKPHPWDVHRAIRKSDANDSSLADFAPLSPLAYSFSAPASPTSATDLLTAAALEAVSASAATSPSQLSHSGSYFPLYGLEALQSLVGSQQTSRAQQLFCR